jgi:hypothetical protein
MLETCVHLPRTHESTHGRAISIYVRHTEFLASHWPGCWNAFQPVVEIQRARCSRDCGQQSGILSFSDWMCDR